MCSECRMTLCPPPCPNYVPKIVGTCPLCNEEITSDEEAVSYDDDIYHYDCIADNALKILFEEHGAKMYEPDDGDEGNYEPEYEPDYE